MQYEPVGSMAKLRGGRIGELLLHLREHAVGWMMIAYTTMELYPRFEP